MAANDQNDDGHDTSNLPDLGDAIDIVTFSQILEMDDSEDDREFSKSIVYGFFEQAEETFEKMDTALEARNLDELYRLGHFLKGSSATLGLTKVKDSCEKVQRYGKKEDLDGTPVKDETVCITRITETLKTLKGEYADVEKTLKKFFNST
ncbi:histidine-phosphotransfer domain, HPT domain-containing protein [Durotheca rogersii]|uniref:histidine-phosphotransfer domain, HPT domain-containing protein n=1 Tax=Durotheca rogersii TaxID=419775 RepID=UPI00221EEF48|nr:histidine-phosphotransfer domain, HPT domain-containing protein [Durotheca rogersii]KAI5862369.1 histidine-phosphotransfer domain, HPT domain-containing protein [Durotheca rogersii]